jgi:hypothetical protein
MGTGLNPTQLRIVLLHATKNMLQTFLCVLVHSRSSTSSSTVVVVAVSFLEELCTEEQILSLSNLPNLSSKFHSAALL